MYQNTLRILILYLTIFSSPTLIDILFGELSTWIELILITFLWGYTWLFIRGKLNSQEKKIPDFFLVILMFCSATVVAISLFLRDIPLAVTIYRLFPYFSFYSLVYLIIYLKRKYKLFKKLLIFTILLCNLVSLGIIYDSLGGLVEVPIIGEQLVKWEQNAGTLQHKLRGGQRRGSFFLGGSTAVYPFLSLGILCSVILFNLEGEKKKYLWGAIPNLVLVWLGCFFSLSRAPLMLGTAIICYGILRLFLLSSKKQLERQIFFALFCFLILLVTPAIQGHLYEQINTKAIKVLNSGLSSQESANYRRYYAWYKGMLLFTEPDSWIGYGLGTSNLAIKQHKLLRYNQYQDHYESSIFSAFSEGGILGLIVILTPFIVIIWSSKNNPERDVYIFWGIMLLINLFAAPIYGYSSQLAYFIGMSFCIALKPSKQKMILVVRPLEINKKLY